MIETIFRIIIIVVILTVILTVVASASVSFNIGSEFLQQNLLIILHYCFFPFRKLLPLIVCTISFTVFKITVSIIKAIWEIFPLKG